MHTKFEVSSLSRSRDIIGGLNISNGSRDVTTTNSGTVCIRRLGLALFNLHTKFKVSTITCNEEINSNAKCKNSRFEPPFWGLMGKAQGSSMAPWKAHCQLPISDNRTFFASSHGCGTIKRNLSKLAYSEGVGHF